MGLGYLDKSWPLTHCGLRTRSRGLKEKKLQVGHGGKGKEGRQQKKKGKIDRAETDLGQAGSPEVQLSQCSLGGGQRPCLTREESKAPKTPNSSEFTLSVIHL